MPFINSWKVTMSNFIKELSVNIFVDSSFLPGGWVEARLQFYFSLLLHLRVGSPNFYHPSCTFFDWHHSIKRNHPSCGLQRKSRQSNHSLVSVTETISISLPSVQKKLLFFRHIFIIRSYKREWVWLSAHNLNSVYPQEKKKMKAITYAFRLQYNL